MLGKPKYMVTLLSQNLQNILVFFGDVLHFLTSIPQGQLLYIYHFYFMFGIYFCIFKYM